MIPRLRLVCIPSADAEFAAAAAALLAEIAVEGEAPAALCERFQRMLRRRFPTSVVRPREPLAQPLLDAAPVWYVTRQPFRSRLAASVDIAAPPDVVYDLYVRPERIPDWQTAMHVTPLKGGPGLIGSEYLARYKVVGALLEGRFRVVDAEPPTYVRIEGQGMGVRVWYATTFIPTSGGTRIEVEGDYDVPASVLAHIADRLFIERAVQRDVDFSHANLKALIEGQSVGRPAAEEPASESASAG